MASPLDGIRFIHAAIMVEAAHLDELAAAARTEQQVMEFHERLRFYENLLTIHTNGEEHHVFPLLEGKLPRSVQTYLFDHREEEEIIRRLERLATPRGGKGPSQPDLAEAARDLRTHLSLHVRKENELIVPLLGELLSIPDQRTLAGALMGEVPKEMYPALLPWLLQRLTEEERVGYLQMVRAGVPPQVFASMAPLVRSSLPADELAPLIAAIPELRG